MNLDDLKFVRLVEGGRKPHYVFEQDKHFYVLTLQDYETRGNFYVFSKIEVDRVKKELLHSSIPNPFNTSDIYKLIKEINSDYLKEKYPTTSEEYISYYIHRLTNICYVLEALKILNSSKDGNRTYFYKDSKRPNYKTHGRNTQGKDNKPRQTIAQKVENLTRENLQTEKSQNNDKSHNKERNKPETKPNFEVKHLTSPEIIQQKLKKIEENKNHGLAPKPMIYNNDPIRDNYPRKKSITDPKKKSIAGQNKLLNDFRKIGNRLKIRYTRAQYDALVNYYGITKVKEAISHDLSIACKNYKKVTLKIPSMIKRLFP